MLQRDVPTKKKEGLGCFNYFLIGGFLFFALIIYTAKTDPSPPIDDTKIDAYTTSKRIIEKVLKAPSTAKFSSFNETWVSFTGIEYTISGYVDAQNTFGAMLRSYYTVVLEGSPSNWRIKQVIFDGKEIDI